MPSQYAAPRLAGGSEGSGSRGGYGENEVAVYLLAKEFHSASPASLICDCPVVHLCARENPALHSKRGIALRQLAKESGNGMSQAPQVRVQANRNREALTLKIFYTVSYEPIPEAFGLHHQPRSTRIPIIGLLGLEDSEQVTAYASLGPAEALEALERAPQHRALLARRRALWAWPPVALRLGAASGSYAGLK